MGCNGKDLPRRGKEENTAVKNCRYVRPVVEKLLRTFGIVEGSRREGSSNGKEFRLGSPDLTVDFFGYGGDHGELLPGNGILELLLEIPRCGKSYERQSYSCQQCDDKAHLGFQA